MTADLIGETELSDTLCVLWTHAGGAMSSSRRWAESDRHTSYTLDSRRQRRRAPDWQPSPELSWDQLQGVHHDAAAYRDVGRLLAAVHDISAAVSTYQPRTVSWCGPFLVCSAVCCAVFITTPYNTAVHNVRYKTDK